MSAGQHDSQNQSSHSCHSSVTSEKQTKNTTMEYQQHNGDPGSQLEIHSNGLHSAIHFTVHRSSTQASANHLSQQHQQGMQSNSSSTTKVVFDYNKNLQCEVPLSSSELVSSSNTSGTIKANGHVSHSNSSNGTIPSESTSSRIPAIITNTRNGKRKPKKSLKELYEEPPAHIALMCYFSYFVLTIFGYLRDFMRKTGLEKNLAAVEKNRDGYPQLYKNFEAFYTRNIYRRIRDCWNRPISSVPGAYIDLIDRYSRDYNWTFE